MYISYHILGDYRLGSPIRSLPCKKQHDSHDDNRSTGWSLTIWHPKWCTSSDRVFRDGKSLSIPQAKTKPESPIWPNEEYTSNHIKDPYII